MKGGTNVAPELAEVGSVIKREGFAVGAAAAAAARGPGGGAIVLCHGSWRSRPEARENAERAEKCGKSEKGENGGKSLNLIKFTKFSIFTPKSPKLPSKKVVQNHGFQVSGEFLDF